MATRLVNLTQTTTVGRTDVVALGPANGDTVKKVTVDDLIRPPEYTVATLPTPATSLKRNVAYVSDGASGAAVMAFCDGTNWRRMDTLAILV